MGELSFVKRQIVIWIIQAKTIAWKKKREFDRWKRIITGKKKERYKNGNSEISILGRKKNLRKQFLLWDIFCIFIKGWKVTN